MALVRPGMRNLNKITRKVNECHQTTSNVYFVPVSHQSEQNVRTDPPKVLAMMGRFGTGLIHHTITFSCQGRGGEGGADSTVVLCVGCAPSKAVERRTSPC